MAVTPNYDLDIDSTLGGDNASDYVIPSQKAIKSYVDNSTGSTVDQVYDPTSQVAQSGIAIAGANFLTSSDLANYVTTDTAQNITGVKTFVGQKMIAFKQSTSSNKLGFTLYNNNNVEKGYLEFNPTNTIDGAPLMTLGNYATSTTAITHVGFRKYSSVSGASGAYNLLAPLISNAKTPFNLTTTYTNFYLPLGFTDGTTMVTTANTGVVDLSSLLPTIGNGTITINQDNVQKGTFTVNQTGNTIINLDGGSGGSSTLAGLSDVELTSLSNGQSLVYNSTSSKWENSSSNTSFYATYNSTTYNEISEAVNQGRSVILSYGRYRVPLSYIGQDSFGFHYWDDNIPKSIWVETDDIWTIATGYAYQKVANLVTSISSSSTNAQYPSAKCVYDNLPTESTVSGWGFTKNVGTVTSVNNIQPDASGNVNVTVSGGANTDLSNLTATGEAHFLKNTASGSNSVTLVGTATSQDNSVNIGVNSSVSSSDGIAIGYYAATSAINTIQLGQGTNSTTHSFQVMSYPLLSLSTGLIPYARVKEITDNNTGSLKFWTGTQAQYDAIVTKDSNTIYNVEDTTSPIISILDSLYPIGAIYIGTMAACPLATLGIGTWQLVAQDRVLQGAGTRGTVGTTINESLPNITGTAQTAPGKSGYTMSGAFGQYSTSTTQVYASGAASSSVTNQYGIDIDASRVSSAYQNNAPVQQDGYLVNIWERIA